MLHTYHIFSWLDRPGGPRFPLRGSSVTLSRSPLDE